MRACAAAERGVSAGGEARRRDAAGGAVSMTGGLALLGVLAVLSAGRAGAFPDGAPWESASSEEGCNECHFDAGATLESEALAIAGLPDGIDPGAVYRLTLSLRADEMYRAGFLLTARQNGAPAGRFTALDDRASTQGAQARSTERGAELEGPGLAEWRLEWTAPAVLEGPVSFELWGNAANDDQSPFGDATHFRVWLVAARTAPAK